MFNSNLVVAVKVNGEVRREDNGCVYLPFGTEYEIFFKNTSDRKAVIDISIDGNDVLGGNQIVVNGNSSSRLERFIVNGDMSKGRKLRFIEKTEQISKHRGNKAEDGLITIRYQFESVACFLGNVSLAREPFQSYQPTYDVNHIGSSGGISMKSMSSSYQANNLASRSMSTSGITTEGSASNQQFNSTHVGSLSSQVHSITLKLFGKSDVGVQIVNMTSTKTKKVCSACGKKNKNSHEYCSRCGTFLR